MAAILKKKYHHYVLFVNTNTRAKFYGHRTYNSEDIEGGPNQPPGIEEPLKGPVLIGLNYLLSESIKNYFNIL